MVFNFKSFLTSRTRNQYLAAVVINIMSVAHGCQLGWVSPVMPYLKSENTHLSDGPLTANQSSWVGSLLSIGSLVAIFTLDFFRERFGKKKSLLLIMFPNLISWVLIYFATNVWFLYASRLFAGLTSGGLLRLIPIITGEFSETRVRGFLGSFFPFALMTGSLLMFVLGGYLDFHIPPLFVIAICIIFFVAMIFLPETPHYYLARNEDEKALKSLMFYRNCDEKNDLIVEELETFKKSVQNVEKKKVEVKDFLARENRKPLLMSFFITGIGGFSGSIVILTYTADIFISSGSSLSPIESSIIVGGIQLLGVYVSTLTTDRFGRKFLFAVSCSGNFLFLFIMGLYDFLIDHEIVDNSIALNWIPIVSLSMAVFVMSLGLTPIPMMMVTELAPHKIREVSQMIFMGVLIGFGFIVLKIFPPMLEVINLYGCIWFFSAISFAGTIITIIFLPETKGKNLFKTENVEK